MVGSRDLPPSTIGFGKVFYNNQFREKPTWPPAGTSLAGKTAIVTGSNTGLGYESARQLLNLNLSRLIIAVRSLEKGESAAKKLQVSNPKAQIEVWKLDMSSYESIQQFASRVDAELSRVEYVLLNAGVMRLSFTKNESTGHGEVFQVNYLSTMLLAILLLPVLKAKYIGSGRKGEPPHLSISSAALSLVAKFPNQNADPLFPSFDTPKGFGQETYNTSKVMAHMFLWKLVEYVKAEDVVMNLPDPAWVKGTDLSRDATGVIRLGMKLFEMTGRTPDVGASCFVDALVNKGKESHGCFLMSWKIHPFAPLLYTPEGRKLTDKVWRETMAELSFARAEEILESMKS